MSNKENSEQNINKNNIQKLNTDVFWLNDPKILIKHDELTNFFPTTSMNLIEKLNAITRLGLYLSIVLVILTHKFKYLYISIIIGLISVFIYKTNENKLELYLNNNKSYNKFTEETLLEKNTTKPTVNNPFMNINLISDNKDRSKAEPSWNNKNIKKDIEQNFNNNLYRDVSDLYGKSNSQRQYYTTPSTTIPNDQTAFAKWCYNTGPTCKEEGINCAPRYNPNTSQSNPFYNINDSA